MKMISMFKHTVLKIGPKMSKKLNKVHLKSQIKDIRNLRLSGQLIIKYKFSLATIIKNSYFQQMSVRHAFYREKGSSVHRAVNRHILVFCSWFRPMFTFK